jgi:hypothetical protein
MHGRGLDIRENLPIYCRLYIASSYFFSICDNMRVCLDESCGRVGACHSIHSSLQPSSTRCSPALDHQRCSTPHDQRRHMAFPLALAAATSTRTHLPLQHTTASIHGALLRLRLHPQVKSHPSSPMLSVRSTVYPSTSKY